MIILKEQKLLPADEFRVSASDILSLGKHKALGFMGYVENLYSGEVLTVVEGDKAMIEELFKEIRIGHSYAHVAKCTIVWHEYYG